MITKTFRIPENKQEALSLINNKDLCNLISASSIEYTEWSSDGTDAYISFVNDDYGIIYNLTDNTLMAMDEDQTYDIILDALDLYPTLESLVRANTNK